VKEAFSCSARVGGYQSLAQKRQIYLISFLFQPEMNRSVLFRWLTIVGSLKNGRIYIFIEYQKTRQISEIS